MKTFLLVLKTPVMFLFFGLVSTYLCWKHYNKFGYLPSRLEYKMQWRYLGHPEDITGETQ